MSVLETLKEYKKLKEEEYALNRKLGKYTHNRILDEKLLGKYTVTLDDFGFTIYWAHDETGYGYYKIIPLDDLKEIERITKTRLVKIINYIYYFRWLDD